MTGIRNTITVLEGDSDITEWENTKIDLLAVAPSTGAAEVHNIMCRTQWHRSHDAKLRHMKDK
jgi:hypothetical protein